MNKVLFTLAAVVVGLTSAQAFADVSDSALSCILIQNYNSSSAKLDQSSLAMSTIVNGKARLSMNIQGSKLDVSLDSGHANFKIVRQKGDETTTWSDDQDWSGNTMVGEISGIENGGTTDVEKASIALACEVVKTNALSQLSDFAIPSSGSAQK